MEYLQFFLLLFHSLQFLCLEHMSERRMKLMEKYSFTFNYKPINLTWFFVGILYCLLYIIAIVAWWITWDKRALIIGIMAPASMIAMVNAYLRFAQNDYHYFQNCEEINKYINKHNTKLEKVRKNVRKFKRNINSKTGGQHTGELTEGEIHELARTKLKHHEDEEISEKAEEEEKEEVQEFDEEEDVINEGGEDKKEEEKGPPTQNKMEKKKTRVIPDKRDHLFANKSLNKDNLFGKAAALVLDDEEVDFETN